MKIGIVGLPNVGKSTLFKALTKKQVDIANYPFCTIDPNVGVVKVPDERLEALARLNASEQIIPASIEFVDIAGLVRGAHSGEGLGNQFLAHIREVDAIAQVVRVFSPLGDIIHVDGSIDPVRDIETINLELIFADLATIEKRIGSLKSQQKAGQDKVVAQHLEIVERLKSALDTGALAHTVTLTLEEKKVIRDLNLLTLKPFIYIINTDEGEGDPEMLSRLTTLTAGYPVVYFCIRFEADVSELSEEESVELGVSRTGLDQLIVTAYEALSLITFFTSGPKETRAWPIRAGSKAPQAAGEIHTDFERGFIRAEVINWKDLIGVGGEGAAKEKGLIRLEGKEYVATDGDVMVFRFSA